jgi:N-acetylmuramoyl-L-alanine amidase
MLAIRATHRYITASGDQFVQLRITIAAVIVCWLSTQAFAEEPRESVLPDGFNVVVIDAGHGGEDDGAKGPGGLQEKDVVLDVARRVAERLRAAQLRVVNTRTEDLFVPLETRTSLANDARADLFISIHANASRTSTARGIETYFASPDYTDDAARQIAQRENEAFGPAALAMPTDPLQALLGDMIATEHMSESSEFAGLVQAELARVDSAPSRGVKQAPFVVLMGVQMPAVLVEIGFLTNPLDEGSLGSNAQRDALADAVARAVSAFGDRYDARRGVSARLSTLKSGD